MALLKVLLLLGLGVSVNSDVSLQKRIIGGHNCANTERLYHIRLEIAAGKRMAICGGSLIHPQWILTAADCWVSDTGINVAVVKVHSRTGTQQGHMLKHQPTLHTADGQQHNIMLLKLRKPVTDVRLAPLPDCSNRPKIGDTVQLAGEGATTVGLNNQQLRTGLVAKHLQCVDMKVVQVSQFRPREGHIFQATAPNKDACHGDAGGAVVFNGMIYGVIAVDRSHVACKKPVTIVDVCEYIGWIKATTGLK